MMIHDLDPAVYDSQNYVVFDLETTNIDYGSALNDRNEVVVACWYEVVGGTVLRRSFFGPMHKQVELFNAIQRADFIVAQNAKFELQWLRRAGVDLTKLVVFDTMLAEYVLAGNRPWAKDLDSIARRLRLPHAKAPYISACIKGGVCPSVLPEKELEHYCFIDVDLTYRAFNEQLAHLKGLNLIHIAYQRSMVAAMLADISFNGMCLDKDVVYTMYRDEMVRYSKSVDDLQAIGDINWNSPDQKRQFLYEELKFPYPLDYKGDPILTSTGQITTKTEHVSSLVPETEDQKTFLSIWGDYAQSNARLTKTLQFFKGVCDQYDRQFVGSIRQGNSRTHRLTSSGAPLLIDEFGKEKSTQFQNIDRTLKGAICAREDGWYIGDTDAASLEFRVAVEIGRDLQGYQDIISGHDVHRFTASILNGISESSVTKGQRQDAKPDTFKPLYYGKSGTPEQRKYYAAFRERYGDIAELQEEWIHEVLDTRELVLPYGMRYYWPDIHVTKSGFVKHSNSICNYPVQGFATAEIVPCGVVKLWAEMKEHWLESFLVNTVHDSVVAEVHPEERNEFHELSTKALTDDMYPVIHKLYGYEIATPLGAECQIGEHWGEGDEHKYESKTPFKFRPRQER